MVGIRLPDSVITILKARAQGESVSAYLKKQIMLSVNTKILNRPDGAAFQMPK